MEWASASEWWGGREGRKGGEVRPEAGKEGLCLGTTWKIVFDLIRGKGK